MKSSSKSNNAIGCLVIIGLILIGGLIHSIVRYSKDKPLYMQAHAAYLTGNCASATPIYNYISNNFRLFDFGELKEKSFNEAVDCQLYQAALDEGINGLYQFTINQPENGLVSVAKNKGIDLIAGLNDASDLDATLGSDTCSLQAELANAGWLNEEGTMSRYLFYCARQFLGQGYADDAFDRLVNLMQTYPNSEMAVKVRRTLNTNPDFCPLLPQISGESSFGISAEMLPNLYLSCGQNYQAVDNLDQAVIMYQDFLDQYPDHPSVADVKKLLAAALIEQARASGSGTIEKPNASGYAPAGVSRVVIQNDSPHDLKLVFSGPDARIEELPACPECTDYTMMGPMYCPEKGPIGTYDLTPGQYEVLVETTHESDITPFTGTWGLEGGSEFYSCFFVVTSYY